MLAIQRVRQTHRISRHESLPIRTQPHRPNSKRSSLLITALLLVHLREKLIPHLDLPPLARLAKAELHKSIDLPQALDLGKRLPVLQKLVAELAGFDLGIFIVRPIAPSLASTATGTFCIAFWAGTLFFEVVG